ncbi:MAG: hypothetical protein U0840_19585 [Gemmataceae bacterium]
MIPLTRVVLYKHGVGYFEREGAVAGDTVLSLTVKQGEVSDVLKSLTVLDLDGGHIASVSYDSTRPLEQLLEDVALSIPDENSLAGLLPQIKGARVALSEGGTRSEGVLLGLDQVEKRTADGVARLIYLSVLSDGGVVQQFDLHAIAGLEVLDPGLRRDLDYYLRTQLLAKKKDARTFSFFARGEGERRVRLSYTVGAPVWKATYRMLVGEPGAQPLLQGWAVVDNTQDEDWENVQLSLVAGLPVSFVHDLYTPRYIRRPVVAVKETTGVLPPEVEAGMLSESLHACLDDDLDETSAGIAPAAAPMMMKSAPQRALRRVERSDSAAMATSTPAQVRERKLGDLFEYEIEHPVTIRRNQSALVPIVLRGFEGRQVLLHNRTTRPQNPMRCVEFKNTTGLTLEGGPVTVLEGGSYVGEAMLETTKPNEQRLVPFAVELSVQVLDNLDSHDQGVQRVVIRDGRLTIHVGRVQRTSYTFDNKSETEQVVYLDHPREANWSLVETTAPVETTENYWRFRFALPAKKATRFVVQQQTTTSRVHALTSMDAQQLGLWLDEKHVDARTEQILREIIEARQRATQVEVRLNQLEAERGRIAQEQERIRSNLQSLGERSAEKELRDRFVRTLGSQEDRLDTIAQEIQQGEAEREVMRQKISALIAGLEFDSTR